MPSKYGDVTGEILSRSTQAVKGRTSDSLYQEPWTAVSDEDGDQVAGADVYVLPESAVTEAAISAEMERGQTDQRGVFQSIALKPGKYRVLATRRKLDHSPESIRLLWLARPKAEELEVAPGKSTAVEVELLSLESR